MTGARRATRFRLPTDVRPVRYDVRLDPDLDRGTFGGTVSIALRIDRRRSSIVLHAAELDVESAVVRTDGGELRARPSANAVDETLTLKLPSRVGPGNVSVELRFRGRLGTQLRGLYGVEAEGRRYAFTQLEAADARRVFPCFDEPSFKARFRITVTARRSDQVLSNMPVEREEAAGRGRRRVAFGETPLLSTYLLALAIGPLEGSSVRRLGKTPIRVWSVPGKKGMTSFALEAAVETLRRLEEYFDLPYPYPKLDLVAVPDFEAGAMENAGAVFFRETLLLLDRSVASLSEVKRAAEVIAHELAHMWYGDLVTMAWWDDLWLNEAFATWMAFRVVDDWQPDWRLWETFEHDRASALALDALTSTHPIYGPVRNVSEATENFDQITYEKGAAVVRMIENYLGPRAFRRGVRLYIRQHREGNTVAADLWRALEKSSGREVARVARRWVEQPGFPLVRLSRVRGNRLRVEQERFFSDPRTPEGKRRERRWPIPLVVRCAGRGGTKTERFLVDRRRDTVKLPGQSSEWVFGNASAGGFYRTLHDPSDRPALLASLPDALSAVERMALVSDQWALVRSRHVGIEQLLDLVDALRTEGDADVLDGLAGPLGFVDDQILGPDSETRERFREWLRSRYRPVFDALGWTGGREETDAQRLRRASLLRLLGLIAEDPDLLEEARERLAEYLRDRGALDANLAEPVVALAARSGDPKTYERYRELARNGRTPQERRRFRMNLAAFRDRKLIDRTLRALVTDEIPTQDVILVLVHLLANPEARVATWRFVRKRWKPIRRRLPPLMVSRLIETMPLLGDPKYGREMREFFREHPVPEARRSLRQATEMFRLNAALRRRAAPAVAKWLDVRTS